MAYITEDEIIHKIKLAFRITSGRLTYGMLDRHLTSNYPKGMKLAVLKKLEDEERIKISDESYYSYQSGRLNHYKLITAIGGWYEK